MLKQQLHLSSGFRKATVIALGTAALVATPTIVRADKGGMPNAHASALTQGAAAQGAGSAGDHGNQGEAALISGVTPVATNTTSYLQFTNAGTQAGTATVAGWMN